MGKPTIVPLSQAESYEILASSTVYGGRPTETRLWEERPNNMDALPLPYHYPSQSDRLSSVKHTSLEILFTIDPVLLHYNL
jgi:hypothetical protein